MGKTKPSLRPLLTYRLLNPFDILLQREQQRGLTRLVTVPSHGMGRQLLVLTVMIVQILVLLQA